MSNRQRRGHVGRDDVEWMYVHRKEDDLLTDITQFTDSVDLKNKKRYQTKNTGEILYESWNKEKKTIETRIKVTKMNMSQHHQYRKQKQFLKPQYQLLQ